MPKSTNLFYEPIPFEMLNTFETKPQLIVNVDGKPAVCHNMTCSFEYIPAIGSVSAFTFDLATKKLTVSGLSFPGDEGYKNVRFAQSICNIDWLTLTETFFECTLEQEPTCGAWSAEVLTPWGYVPVDVGVSNITVACTISMVTPDTELNVLGYDLITITANNLPYELTDNEIDITFTNGGSTKCIPQTTSQTDLSCMTMPFDKVSDLSSSLNLNMVINRVLATNPLNIGTKAKNEIGLTMIPLSVSPVLKSEITFHLMSDFPHTLSTSDFSINATSQHESTYMKRMNVIRVDDAAKSVTVKFGGAQSGLYSIIIRHAAWGLIDTSSLTLRVESDFTNFSPMSGSIYGGTLVTITGTNWGTIYTDNPVEISYNGALGSTKCFVQTTSATEITCRIDSIINKDAGEQGKMLVFLKTYEEANCTLANDCQFAFTSILPEIVSVNPSFNAVLNAWTLIVSGTGFTGDSTNVQFYVKGVLQTTNSVTSTEAVFQISNI